jgi:hypothetical protein
MARYRNEWALGFFNKKEALFRLQAEARDSRWLAIAFVSGTVVAPVESRELQRFEIS